MCWCLMTLFTHLIKPTELETNQSQSRMDLNSAGVKTALKERPRLWAAKIRSVVPLTNSCLRFNTGSMNPQGDVLFLTHTYGFIQLHVSVLVFSFLSGLWPAAGMNIWKVTQNMQQQQQLLSWIVVINIFWTSAAQSRTISVKQYDFCFCLICRASRVEVDQTGAGLE